MDTALVFLYFDALHFEKLSVFSKCKLSEGDAPSMGITRVKNSSLSGLALGIFGALGKIVKCGPYIIVKKYINQIRLKIKLMEGLQSIINVFLAAN